MNYLSLIGTVATAHLLAVIVPGPDFIIVCRNALTYSRKSGIWTSVGLGIGCLIHISISLAGIAFIVSKSIIIFNIIKFLGASYLIYIGIKSIRCKSSKIQVTDKFKSKDISILSSLKIGFLTNVLNPKATLFFLSLFTVIISPKTPMSIMGIMSIIMILNTMIWFSFLSLLITQKNIRLIFEKFQDKVNKFLGGLLIFIGMKVALSKG